MESIDEQFYKFIAIEDDFFYLTMKLSDPVPDSGWSHSSSYGNIRVGLYELITNIQINKVLKLEEYKGGFNYYVKN